MEKLNQLSHLAAQMNQCDSLNTLLEYASHLLQEPYCVDGISLWTFSDDEQAFECTFYSGTEPSNLGKQIPRCEIPTSLLEPSRFQLFTTRSDMSADEQTFLEQFRAAQPNVKDYFLTPLAPADQILGFLSIRTTCLISQWQELDLNPLLVAMNHIKERFIRDQYLNLVNALQREKALLDEIQDIAKVGGWQFNLSTNELYWSEETYRIYGYPIGSLVTPEQAISHYSGEDKEHIANDFDLLITHHIPYEREFRFVDTKGKNKWIRTTGRVRVRQGKATHVYGAFEDITKEKTLIHKEQDATKYLATIIDNLNDVIVTVNEDGLILTANSRLRDVFGYDPDELIGKNVSCLMPNPYADLHQQYIGSYLKTGNAKILGIGREVPAMKKNQQVFPIELALTEVLQDDKRIFIGIIKDITERKNAEDKIYKLAYFNPLTNLPNAFSFEEHIAKHIDKVRLVNGKLLLMKMDIDHFSKINLTHGRKAGDYAISLIADRLRAVIDNNFEVFHYRGDIFYFLSRHSHIQKEADLTTSCAQLAKRLLDVLQDDIIIEGVKYRFNASIVSSIIDGTHASLEVLSELLNMAVKQLKNEGGNRHVILDNRAHHYLERRAKIKTHLPFAVEHIEFYLALQPQFNTEKQYCSSEVLIRWHSKELGFVAPNEFIEIAEETGDIIDIGCWILEEVATLISRFNPPGRLAINISAKQLAKDNFEQELFRIFDSKNVPLNKIVLEVTESTLVQDLHVIRSKLERLTQLGAEFSIDDFGTGYSSLSYLQNLNIHEIKIDKSFIDEIKDSSTSVPIVDSIIQLSTGLGARVVAEGVENIGQFNYLADRSCQLLQGYLLAKPLSVADWLNFIEHTGLQLKH